MATLAKRSFASGEISPSLYARVDISKYATGLKTCRNFYVMRHGGVLNRPGTQFIQEVKDSSKTVRLIPFVFSTTQTYCLEFGDLYIRVIKDGVQQTLAGQSITAITNANPCVLTYSGADTYTAGDEIYISGITGAIGTYLNNRNFKCASVNAGTNAITLDYMDGTNVDSTSFGAYTSGGTIEEVYEIVTPYEEADLPELKFIQSADVITITHPNYPPSNLARTGDTSWTLSEISFAPAISRPTGGSASAGAAGSNSYRYRVTAVAQETFEESLPGTGASTSITGATKTNPVVITYSGADIFANGDEVSISGVVGMTEINDLEFTVAGLNAGANTFQLSGVDGTGYTAYSSGGTVALSYITLASAAVATPSAPHTVTWSAVTGAQEYNVYKAENGIYGLIGISASTTHSDTGLDPDTLSTPPIRRTPFRYEGDFPSTVCYFQQRQIFANQDNDTEAIYGSRIGQFNNFTTSSPLQDDDAVTFNMAGRQVNEVNHLLDLGALVVFTQSGEWSIRGDASGILTPSNINPKQYSYNGSYSRLAPIVIGNSAIYCQARGSVIRDLGFSFEIDGYKGDDLTLFSSHLFDNYTLNDWAFQQIPHSIVWVARSDGKLLGMTYLKDQQLLAWHQHDFEDATVENVCTVPEGNEDTLYLTINRTVNGSTKRYIEKFSTRKINDIEDLTILDCFLSYDGRNSNASHTMTLTGSGWTYTDTLTLTSSAAFFTASDIGNEIQISGPEGDIIRCSITAFTSTTIVSVLPSSTVPASMRSVALNTWDRAVDSVSGLWHIEGKSVSIFADGFVVANPNNDAYTVVTVTNGTINLDRCYGLIHVGLPITADLETLNIDSAQSETISDKKNLITKLTIFVEDSRGIWAGSAPPPDEATDFLGGLTELKIRNFEGYNSPTDLATGTVDVVIQGHWNSNGRIFIRQTDPLPLSVLAVAPSGLYPFSGGG